MKYHGYKIRGAQKSRPSDSKLRTGGILFGEYHLCCGIIETKSG